MDVWVGFNLYKMVSLSLLNKIWEEAGVGCEEFYLSGC